MMNNDGFEYYKNLLADAKNLYGMINTILDLDVFGLVPGGNIEDEDREYEAKCLWFALRVMAGVAENKIESLESDDMSFLKGVASSVCNEILVDKKINRHNVH